MVLGPLPLLPIRCDVGQGGHTSLQALHPATVLLTLPCLAPSRSSWASMSASTSHCRRACDLRPRRSSSRSSPDSRRRRASSSKRCAARSRWPAPIALPTDALPSPRSRPSSTASLARSRRPSSSRTSGSSSSPPPTRASLRSTTSRGGYPGWSPTMVRPGPFYVTDEMGADGDWPDQLHQESRTLWARTLGS